MATKKITITLPDEQFQEIRGLVSAGQAANVSAFVQRAVASAPSDAVEWRDMLQEALMQTGGPLAASEIAWADSVLSPARTTSAAQSNRGRRRGKSG